MLKLYVFPRNPSVKVINAGPACLKLETWLRIADIPYEIPATPPPAPPKGKFPFVDDDGALIGDSTLILEHLKRTRKIDPDGALTPQERAIGLAFRRMMKENFYWCMVQTRYQSEAGWGVWSNVLKPIVLMSVGGDESAAQLALDGIRKVLQEQLFSQGMGRHTEAEVHEIGIQDLTAVSDFLGSKPFFFGELPTATDATIYSHLANLLEVPLDSPSTQFARGRRNLVDYCARMRERFFPETLNT
jgi:glutathione S-transferase